MCYVGTDCQTCVSSVPLSSIERNAIPLVPTQEVAPTLACTSDFAGVDPSCLIAAAVVSLG